MSVTANAVRERAKQVGWSEENQRLWLFRKNADSWESASEGIRQMAMDMMDQAANVFGEDEIEGLRVYRE